MRSLVLTVSPHVVALSLYGVPSGSPARLLTMGVILPTLLAIACASSPAQPSGRLPVRLTATLSDTTLTDGETATAAFELRNTGERTITIDFTTSCQILPYVTDRRTERIVHPEGGGWACLQALSHIVLAPGETRTRNVQLRAGSGGGSQDARLPRGEYEAYAQLEGRVEGERISLRTTPVRFEVR